MDTNFLSRIQEIQGRIGAIRSRFGGEGAEGFARALETAAKLTLPAPKGPQRGPEGPEPLRVPLPGSPTPAPTGALACERDRPAGNPTIGTSRQGEYLGQQLPQGYHVYGSEAEVTAAIQRVYDNGGDWACFQRFYPGASTVFKRRGRL